MEEVQIQCLNKHYMLHLNKRGKIFFGSILAIISLIILIVCLSSNSNDEILVEPTEPIQNTEPIDFIRTSTKSWANNAWLKYIEPDLIKAIEFVPQSDQVMAEKAWGFDGINFYFYEGTVSIASGEMLKITGSMNRAFADLTNLETIGGLERIDTSEVTDMSGMFQNCSNLKSLPIQHLKTDSVVLAPSMFEGCSSLAEMDLSELNMKNTIDMSKFMSGCSSVKLIKFPQTRDVQTLSRAFEFVGLSSQYLTFEGELNTSNCEDMSYMFNRSSTHSYQFAENFDTSSLKNAEGMFYECGIMEIDLSKWNTSNLETTKQMFYMNQFMTKCNTSDWDMSSLKNCESMFYKCGNIREMDLGWTNVKDIQNAAYLFKFCFVVETIDISCFNGILIGDSREMFSDCYGLTTIYCDGFETDVSDNMFLECTELKGFNEKRVDAIMATADGYFSAK